MNVLFAVESFAWDSYSLIGAMSFLSGARSKKMEIDTKKIKPGDEILLDSGIRLVAVAPGANVYSPPSSGEEAVQFACDRCGAVHYGRRCYASMKKNKKIHFFEKSC